MSAVIPSDSAHCCPVERFFLKTVLALGMDPFGEYRPVPMGQAVGDNRRKSLAHSDNHLNSSPSHLLPVQGDGKEALPSSNTIRVQDREYA
jgi:hypothetical protein